MTDTYRIRSPEVWAQARDAYVAGATAETVCARFDLGRTAFRERARDQGWRRADLDDPEPLPPVEDDEDLPDLDDAALMALARRRMATAIQRGLIGEALRWGRMRELIRRQASAEAHDDQSAGTAAARQSLTTLKNVTDSARSIARQAETALALVRAGATPKPDNPDNPDSDFHADDSSDPSQPPVSRAERRRLANLARKRR